MRGSSGTEARDGRRAVQGRGIDVLLRAGLQARW